MRLEIGQYWKYVNDNKYVSLWKIVRFSVPLKEEGEPGFAILQLIFKEWGVGAGVEVGEEYAYPSGTFKETSVWYTWTLIEPEDVPLVLLGFV